MHVAPFTDDLARELLAYLGHAPDGRTADELIRLQRAFLDRVPYENLEIQLGRPTTIDPVESAQRIMTGRGGYCFHLNGTFATLLVSLGYDVTLARGKVTGHDDTELGNHMVIMVHLDGTTWLPDVGLGDGYRDPIVLRESVYDQAPFSYRLEHLSDQRWRLHHDDLASIPGIDFDLESVPPRTFEPNHAHLSTSPDSSFVHKLVVQQRRWDHALSLRGCVLTRADKDGRGRRDTTDRDDWCSLIRDEFGLSLDSDDLAALWRRVKAAHDEWDADGRP